MIDLLNTRDLTADERIVIADEPRNGVWWQPSWMLGGPADKRPLTQEQTDQLIALELRDVYNDFPHGDVFKLTEHYKPAPLSLTARIIRPEPEMRYVPPEDRRLSPSFTFARTAHRQRNGIHSEPVIRLLAFRAWGNRDREWQSTIDALIRAVERVHGRVRTDTVRIRCIEAVQQMYRATNEPRARAFFDDLLDYFRPDEPRNY